MFASWEIPAASRVSQIKFLPANTAPDPENIEHKPVDQVLSECNMTTWTHTLWGPVPTINNLVLANISDESRLTETKLALTPMPEGLSGLEVVAIADIPQGSRIIYAGLKGSLKADDPYAAGACAEEMCSALGVGNISRFMSHAFSAKALDQHITFTSPELKDQVALSNFVGASYKNTALDHGITCMIATRDIHPGERVRWDYSLEHFDALDIAPALFSHDNVILKSANYYYTNTEFAVKFSSGSVCFPIKDIIEKSNMVFIPAAISLMAYDLFLGSEYISELIRSNPQILSKHRIWVTLPEQECEQIKYCEPNSVPDIRLHLWRHAQSRMLEPDIDTLYTIVSMPVAVIAASPHQPRKQGHAGYVVSGDFESIEAKRQKLESDPKIEVCCTRADDPEKDGQEIYSLWINQNSLFKTLPSEPVPRLSLACAADTITSTTYKNS